MGQGAGDPLTLLLSELQAGARQALAEAALLDEFSVEAEQLLGEQVVGLVDEADRDVGDGLRRASLDEFPKVFVAQRGFATELAYVLCLL